VDPLSDVLALLDLRAAAPARLEAGGRWALSFEGHRHLKVGAVLAGACWLTAGDAEPMRLTAGDCYLLASSHPYVVASDPAAEPVPSRAVLPSPWPGTAYYNLGPAGPEGPGPERTDPERTVLVSGSLSFDETAAALLLDHLPPSVRIAAGHRRAAVLRPVLELLGEETAAPAPGSATMRDHLTHILFVQALRTLLGPAAEPDGPAPGWLAALGDPAVGTALALMHQRPARRWTVAELAAAASMSRSSFAARFRTLVGQPPLAYLARWRAQLAARALRSTDRTVAAIAADLGWSSESAFSNAFKRGTGQSPAGYRAARRRSGPREPAAADSGRRPGDKPVSPARPVQDMIMSYDAATEPDQPPPRAFPR
jgi:AraC-like DNA-binding protein